MADLEPGKMNIKEQEQAYDLFVKNSFRIAAGCAVILWLMYVFLT